METHRASHLTDEELFGLALPPAGEPEALPPHVLACGRCGRALQDWKAAIRDVGEEDVEAVNARSAAEWRAVEDRTLDSLRRVTPRRSRRPVAWAAGLAAAVLLALLIAPGRRAAQAPAAGVAAAPSRASEMSPQDAADDALLRDVARLSRGDDVGSWGGLVPDPTAVEEGRL
ncbi:MAG TPA: hypothetical protein VIA45_04580 [Thermoanaerobaculia bacterium]|jgi:hypothetical protein